MCQKNHSLKRNNKWEEFKSVVSHTSKVYEQAHKYTTNSTNLLLFMKMQ
jgi:hypothetical protein